VARGTREGGIRAKIHADQDGACYLIRRSARPYWCECRTAIEAVRRWCEILMARKSWLLANARVGWIMLIPRCRECARILDVYRDVDRLAGVG
jgi:hypothetical protein